jgi:hypothetical protein
MGLVIPNHLYLYLCILTSPHTADPEEIIRKNGVDPYVFVRFLQMMAKAMIPIWLLSWLILLPVDSVRTGVSGKEGLDRLTFGNVGTDRQERYWAHLILDWVFIGEFYPKRSVRGVLG